MRVQGARMTKVKAEVGEVVIPLYVFASKDTLIGLFGV